MVNIGSWLKHKLVTSLKFLGNVLHGAFMCVRCGLCELVHLFIEILKTVYRRIKCSLSTAWRVIRRKESTECDGVFKEIRSGFTRLVSKPASFVEIEGSTLGAHLAREARQTVDQVDRFAEVASKAARALGQN